MSPISHCERLGIPPARMEAVMQHLQVEGVPVKVSRLAAARRRHSTNSMCKDRWLLFTGWATEKGIVPLEPTAAQVSSLFSFFETHGLLPQTVKG